MASIILLMSIFTFSTYLAHVNCRQNGNWKHKILVSTSNGTDNSSCWINSSFPCASLWYAMQKPNLNNTIVILEHGTHALAAKISRQSVHNLCLQGERDNVYILCNVSDVGISFSLSTQITLVSLTLLKCGTSYSSTSASPVPGELHAIISTALHMRDCRNVTLLETLIAESIGMAAVFYNVTGHLSFIETSFLSSKERKYLNYSLMHMHTEKTESSNKVKPSYFSGYSSGGGLYVELLDLSNNVYVFKRCHFSNNTAENELSVPSSSGLATNSSSFVSFGRGGGLSVMVRGSSSNNYFNLDSCVFVGNLALWGSGAFIEYHDNSRNNSIVITNTLFMNNTATYGGGGLRIGCCLDMLPGNNTLIVEHCNFTRNKAKAGGGFTYFRTDPQGRPKDKGVIRNCTFMENLSMIGFALNIQLVFIDIHDTSFLNNTLDIKSNENNSGQGAIYCYSSDTHLLGRNLFLNNSHTALVMDTCHIAAYDNLIFYGNYGLDGGAMSIYGHSWLQLKQNSKVDFMYNVASKRGGAIYVEVPGPPVPFRLQSTEFKTYTCFIVFGNVNERANPNNFNTTVRLIGNKALSANGNAIFASTLNWCRQRDETRYNNSALRWKTFHYHEGEFRNMIVTSPIQIHVANKGDWQTSPGKEFSPEVILHDELWNSVYGTVRVKVTPKSKTKQVMVSGSDLFIVKDKINSISVNGKEGSEYDLSLETMTDVHIKVEIQNLTLKKCPLGFFQPENSIKCKCISREGAAKGVTRCNNNEVYVLRGRWGNPLAHGVDFATYVCPKHYCNKKCEDGDGIDCLYNPKKQCAEHRQWNSTLCGKCISGYSVRLGDEACARCNDVNLLWILLIFVALSVFVLLIMLLNVDTYSTYLNVCLYCYQTMPLFLANNESIDRFMSVIVGLLSFSGSGGIVGVCLWNGMTDLEKMAFNYIIPVYIILFTVIISSLSQHIESCWFNKNSCSRAFALLSVFAYSDFTRISFTLLHLVKVGSEYVVYNAGEVKYFKGEHIPYAVVAMLMFVFIVLFFPFVLVFSHHVIKLPGCARLMGVFDAFQSCFKPEFKAFSAFYLFCRVALFAVGVFLPNDTLQRTLLGITCIFILVFFALVKPYKIQCNSMNYFDLLVLTIISVISTLNIASGECADNTLRRQLNITMDVICYIPFLCLIGHLSNWLFKRLKQVISKKRCGQTTKTSK